MNIIKDWGFLQKAHKILDLLPKRETQVLEKGADSQGLDRRRFLKYAGGFAGVAVVAPKIFLAPTIIVPELEEWVPDEELIAKHFAPRGWYTEEIRGEGIVNARALYLKIPGGIESVLCRRQYEKGHLLDLSVCDLQ